MRFATFAEFDTWLITEHNKVKLEEGALELGPRYGPTAEPGVPPWKLEWCIKFHDGKYILAVENYYAEKKRLGGAGYRKYFSFHYGEWPALQDTDGWPKWRDEKQFDLRIDEDQGRGPHIHFNGNSHIPQDRVHGLEISKQSMFDFVSLIHEHRRSGKPLNEVFGFTVAA